MTERMRAKVGDLSATRARQGTSRARHSLQGLSKALMAPQRSHARHKPRQEGWAWMVSASRGGKLYIRELAMCCILHQGYMPFLRGPVFDRPRQDIQESMTAGGALQLTLKLPRGPRGWAVGTACECSVSKCPGGGPRAAHMVMQLPAALPCTLASWTGLILGC